MAKRVMTLDVCQQPAKTLNIFLIYYKSITLLQQSLGPKGKVQLLKGILRIFLFPQQVATFACVLIGAGQIVDRGFIRAFSLKTAGNDPMRMLIVNQNT